MVMVFHLGALLKPRVGRDEKQEQKCLVHQQDKTAPSKYVYGLWINHICNKLHISSHRYWQLKRAYQTSIQITETSLPHKE